MNGVEPLRDRLNALVLERQRLRSSDAHPLVLEENRLAIVRCQSQLSIALIERHLPRAPLPHPV